MLALEAIKKYGKGNLMKPHWLQKMHYPVSRYAHSLQDNIKLIHGIMNMN